MSTRSEEANFLEPACPQPRGETRRNIEGRSEDGNAGRWRGGPFLAFG